MEALYNFLNDNNRKLEPSNIENIEKLFIPFITSSFFPWVCIILLLNRKNWKRPIILILIMHWFMRSMGDFFRNSMSFREYQPNMAWPGSMNNWYISQGIAHTFWLSGEIIGDWYPLIRTKAVTNDKKKIKIILGCCIAYNLAKIFGMFTFYISDVDLRLEVDGKPNNGLAKQELNWWIAVGLMQITSFLYDGSVIYALKTNLFNKLKQYSDYSKTTFMDKFKSISELRIFCSMIISLIFFPFLIYFIIILIVSYYEGDNSDEAKVYTQIEHFRQVVLSFNFTMMYIDQILLRSISEKKNQGNSHSNSKNNLASSTSILPESYNNYRKLNNQNAYQDNLKSSSYNNIQNSNFIKYSNSQNSLTITSPYSTISKRPTNDNYNSNSHLLSYSTNNFFNNNINDNDYSHNNNNNNNNSSSHYINMSNI
ncbi:hypothetical protein PIROE2DRAFT_58482 [Piromyces sp. E2]|nr:hypothetical protein PIROE2DRAFT_58482 [Piromyces sp. E2]|eukprot:OUM67893.1 hypothetical protein PIROE2DRAFT_58482 [Piromyces sp. E2]